MTRAELIRRGLSAQEVREFRAAVIAERARRSGSRSFASFVKQAWPLVDPTPIEWNWHVDAICDHLEAVSRGEIRRLLINVPPGHAKSLLVSVLWPAWMWTWKPSWQAICASYNGKLAERDSIKARDLMLTSWYREQYGDPGGWRLADDQNKKDYYKNTAFGHRISIGVDGGTGLRADAIVIDDPLNAQEAHSRAAREVGIRFISQTASTRFNKAETGVMVMIMQRLHQQDPSGFVLAGGGWEHLCLPAEFEPRRRSITYRIIDGERKEFWRDPREQEGELLFPKRFPKAVLDDLKKPNSLGAYGFAGQEQQNPAPADGGIFKRKDWRFWQPDLATRERLGYSESTLRPEGCETADDAPARALDLNDLDLVILSVDGAGGSETEDGSFNAIHVWASKGARRCLLYRIHRRMDFHDTVQALLKVIEMFPQARRKRIEAKASGSSIISTLEKQHGITGLEPVNPGKQSKLERAHAMQPYQVAHNVELPEGAEWTEEYIEEHAAFPRGAHDDDVDAQSQGLQGLEEGRTAWDEWGDEDPDYT